MIGCLIVSTPVFFDKDAWLVPPLDWPKNAVQGKLYDLSTGEGARVWNDCRTRASSVPHPATRGAESPPRYGEPVLVRPRFGQGAFRLAVTAAYDRACAVTSEHSLPALEAAHIRPFSDEGPHEVSNGLLLRSDIHRLFDMGYVGVTPEYRFVVSRTLKDDFENGRSYYPLHGQSIHVPRAQVDRPDRDLLRWHAETLFCG